MIETGKHGERGERRERLCLVQSGDGQTEAPVLVFWAAGEGKGGEGRIN